MVGRSHSRSVDWAVGRPVGRTAGRLFARSIGLGGWSVGRAACRVVGRSVGRAGGWSGSLSVGRPAGRAGRWATAISGSRWLEWGSGRPRILAPVSLGQAEATDPCGLRLGGLHPGRSARHPRTTAQLGGKVLRCPTTCPGIKQVSMVITCEGQVGRTDTRSRPGPVVAQRRESDVLAIDPAAQARFLRATCFQAFLLMKSSVALVKRRSGQMHQAEHRKTTLFTHLLSAGSLRRGSILFLMPLPPWAAVVRRAAFDCAGSMMSYPN